MDDQQRDYSEEARRVLLNASVASELEMITFFLRDAVKTLRDDQTSGPEAYALVYLIRHKLGQQVARLGAGTPPTKDVNLADIFDWAALKLAELGEPG